VAAKVTVLRNTRVGRGCVLGAHAVVKGDIPDFSIAVGSPAKAVKNRRAEWEAGAEERAKYIAALEDIARKKAAREG
jgi:acetyltransferase-like isoleucine patch superfamily enzyme